MVKRAAFSTPAGLPGGAARNNPQSELEAEARKVGALLSAGKLEQAESAARRLIANYKKAPVGHNILGAVLARQGRRDDAIKAYRQAIKLNSKFAEAHSNLGTVYRDLKRFVEAAASHRRALAARPDYLPARYNLANVLGDLGETAAALVEYDRVIAANPDHFQAHYNKGLLLQQLGRLPEAQESIEAAIAINPNFAEGYRSLARHVKFTVQTPALAALRALVSDPSLAKADLMHAKLALAKANEDLGDHPAAFECYVDGNSLRRSMLRYQPQQQLAYFNRLKEEANVLDLAASPAGAGQMPAPTPIFVVGMPRSGTSLVEQILASHSQVHGAGELPHFSDLESEFLGPQQNRQTDLLTISEDRRDRLFARWGKKYREELKKLQIDAPFMVDKSPANFRYLPFIRQALPEAKLVHVCRDPHANCWAVFKTYFASGGYFYSYDLKETVQYHNWYRDLMRHWHKQMPGQIFDIHYENLVTDQRAQTEALLTACGLDWQDQVLAFHQTQRTVKTASATQVRQPLYTSSLEDWRRYETQLAPHFEALSP